MNPTTDFLRKMLPADGNYCGGLIHEGKYRQKLFSSIEDLGDFLYLASEKGADVYYAVSSFKTTDNRKGANVQGIKLLALDLDVGKVANSYATREEALTALQKFIRAKSLPKPTIIQSGAGFHVYWMLNRELTVEEWSPIAHAFKACAEASGLIIDPTVTADAARILRPCGTKHVKTGREVKVLMEGPENDPDTLVRLFGPVAPARKYSLIDNLKITPDFPPADGGVVASKCQQIQWAVTHQDEVPEPLWYSLMGIAAHTTDPEGIAIAWSEQHPTYNRRDTITKLEQWQANVNGPATCQRFEDARPGGCKGCKFLGKINTPVRLGATFEEVAPAQNAPVKVEDIYPVPAPFKRTAQGMKMTIDGSDVDVCSFDIYPVGYGKDDALGYEVVRYHWNRPHVGWTELKLRQAYLTEGHREFPSSCADQGIVLPGKRATELFQIMLRNYMEDLRRRKSMTNLYTSMGWKDDYKQFIVGDTVMKHEPDGAVTEEASTLSSGASRLGDDMYGLKGTKQSWADGTMLLQRAGMPWHMFALGMGFAAPLFAFTGLKGLTVSLYGPTGGGKTLVQYWIQSIYGNPDKLHFAAKYTQNSLFSRLSTYAHMPMTIDEATMLSDKDVGDFLYWVSQGRDKARLNRSAEERDAKTWATPVIVSTNKSMQAKLISSGLDTDAQMARLLELSVPSHKIFSNNSDAGQKIYNHLMNNYGVVGREYLRELLTIGPDGIKKLIDEERMMLRTKYGAKFTGEERYWEQAVVLQELGSKIAKRLGLITYDYELGTRWVLEQVGAIRTQATANKGDAFDTLAEYLNENADSAVTVMQTGTTKPVADHSRLPRGELRIRFDLFRATQTANFTSGTIMVHRAHLRRWLAKAGVDWKTFMTELETAGATKGQPHRAYIAKDTPIKVGQTYVVQFDLTHPKLEGILNEADDKQTNPTHLKVVTNE